MQLTASYWAWFGIMMLFWMTAQDYYRGMRVDDRKNYFMYGLTFSLLAVYARPAWYLIIVIALVLGMGYFIRKFKLFGDADTNAISWMILGFTFIGFYSLIWFLLTFSVLTFCWHSIKVVLFKIMRPTPFFAVLLITFSFSCWINGLL